MKPKEMALWLAIAALLITMALVYPSHGASGPSRSVYDGSWIITFYGCDGKVTVYEDCYILDLNDVFVTFRSAGRSREIKLPITTGCSHTIWERRH